MSSQAENPSKVTEPSSLVQLLLVGATLIGFLFFLAEGYRNFQDAPARLAGKLLKAEPRAQAPLPFDLESLDGGKVKLSEFRDKIVFLNFWATWCPPCLEEMPSMKRLHERLKGSNIEMLAVSADDSWEPVRKLFATDKAPFKVLLDPSGELAKQYGTTMFPETYIIADGRIVGFIEGPRDWDDWFADQYLLGLQRKPNS